MILQLLLYRIFCNKFFHTIVCWPWILQNYTVLAIHWCPILTTMWYLIPQDTLIYATDASSILFMAAGVLRQSPQFHKNIYRVNFRLRMDNNIVLEREVNKSVWLHMLWYFSILKYDDWEMHCNHICVHHNFWTFMSNVYLIAKIELDNIQICRKLNVKIKIRYFCISVSYNFW